MCACAVQMRGMSSALSAASSACDHMRDWIRGTPSGTFISMGVFSDGSYNAPKVPRWLSLHALQSSQLDTLSGDHAELQQALLL